MEKFFLRILNKSLKALRCSATTFVNTLSECSEAKRRKVNSMKNKLIVKWTICLALIVIGALSAWGQETKATLGGKVAFVS